MNEFLIAFRESLEAALIVGIIYVVLLKQGAKAQLRMLWLSVGAAIAASAVLGIGLYEALENAGEATKELLEGIMMYITAGLLFYVIFWMSKTLASRSEITKQTNTAVESGKWGVFFLVFFAIVREGFETALFLVASTGIDNAFSYIGFFAGVALAVLIGYLIVVQGKRIELRPYFKWTSLLLVFFAAGMIAYGTHEIHEYMEYREHEEHAEAGEEAEEEEGECHEYLEHAVAINNQSAEHAEAGEAEEEEEEHEYAFDIFKNKIGEPLGGMYVYHDECGVNVHMLNANGAIGSFLKGLFGYSTSPTWMELILWAVSLVFGIFIWRRAYTRKKE